MTGQPGDRSVAPGGLAVVQAFVNSVNIEFGPDEFETLEGLAAWLQRHRLPGAAGPLDALDRQAAVTLREALRQLLRENNGAETRPDAARTVSRIGRECPVVVGVDETGQVRLTPSDADAKGALAVVLAAVASAWGDGTWQRLKACGENTCEWVFFDRSRNRSGRWCSMDGCGSRAKMRSYRERRLTAVSAPAS